MHGWFRSHTFWLLFQLHNSEAGRCEEGVGEGGLPGAEGICRGGCPGWGSQSPPVAEPARRGWQFTQPDSHSDTNPRTWTRETAAGLFAVCRPGLPQLCVSGELFNSSLSVWGGAAHYEVKLQRVIHLSDWIKRLLLAAGSHLLWSSCRHVTYSIWISWVNPECSLVAWKKKC